MANNIKAPIDCGTNLRNGGVGECETQALDSHSYKFFSLQHWPVFHQALAAVVRAH